METLTEKPVRNNEKPLYVQVYEYVKEGIKEGKFAKGQPIPSQKELCRDFNVSQITVKQAFKELKREGIISQVVGKNAHVSTELYPDEKIEQSNQIAIGCVHAFEGFRKFVDPFFVNIYAGIEEEASIKGVHIEFYYTIEELRNLQLFGRKINRNCISGVILVGEGTSAVYNTFIQKIEDIVAIDTSFGHPKVQRILVDLSGGAFSAVEHLIKIGHKRIGFIGGTAKRGTYPERIEGYLHALRKYGLEEDNDLIQNTVQWYPEKGYLAMKRLLTLSPMPSAVFTGCDHLAIGAMKAVRERNMKIPDDLALVGFDDIDLSEQTVPPLTTVHVPTREMGRIAVRELIRRINGEKNFETITLPTQLVIRDSCGALCQV